MMQISGKRREKYECACVKYIIRAFVRGFAGNGNTTEVLRLSDKKQWTGAKEAFEKNTDILFVAGQEKSCPAFSVVFY